MAFLVFGNSYALQIDEAQKERAELLEKYKIELTEMKQELKSIARKVNDSKILEDLTEELSQGILVRHILEDDGIVTLSVPYTIERSSPSIEYPANVSHATLFSKSTWNQNSGFVTLTNVQGSVLQFFDGATCQQISVTAGQSDNYSFGGRTNSFIEYGSSYNKSYSWPWIGTSPGGHDLGHTAYFSIKRGTVTRVWQITCNKSVQFDEEV